MSIHPAAGVRCSLTGVVRTASGLSEKGLPGLGQVKQVSHTFAVGAKSSTPVHRRADFSSGLLTMQQAVTGRG